MCLFYFSPANGLTLFIPLPLILFEIRWASTGSYCLLKKSFFAAAQNAMPASRPGMRRNPAKRGTDGRFSAVC